jgi:hypothetical protein
MQDVRRDVGEDVRGIVETAKTLSDWRYYVKNHPWACVGAALAAGFVLAPRGRHKAPPDMQELAALLKKYNVPVAPPRAGNQGLARTLVGLAAPIVMRTVMTAAQQRFGANGSPLSSFFGSSREDEPVATSNIPR